MKLEAILLSNLYDALTLYWNSILWTVKHFLLGKLRSHILNNTYDRCLNMYVNRCVFTHKVHFPHHSMDSYNILTIYMSTIVKSSIYFY